ncbi:uncharacterized protein KY384_002364 [Bacidia gigantensis]|uniref:uncharacterized protein n=1 Tax=Bacidia gigantensis TaxID=2732470 RepID=UPI001D0402B3|nr:uncharacterized protein KY384_002364 [Bacidia gigantensis]KAG8532487.1 hypothetical protein KY384_002364 [Bacidia gigantensis]
MHALPMTLLSLLTTLISQTHALPAPQQPLSTPKLITANSLLTDLIPAHNPDPKQFPDADFTSARSSASSLQLSKISAGPQDTSEFTLPSSTVASGFTPLFYPLGYENYASLDAKFPNQELNIGQLTGGALIIYYLSKKVATETQQTGMNSAASSLRNQFKLPGSANVKDGFTQASNGATIYVNTDFELTAGQKACPGSLGEQAMTTLALLAKEGQTSVRQTIGAVAWDGHIASCAFTVIGS